MENYQKINYKKYKNSKYLKYVLDGYPQLQRNDIQIKYKQINE